MNWDNFSELFSRYGYLFLFAGAFVDGFHIMLIAGFLIAINKVELAPAFLALLMGNVLSDVMWYSLSYIGGEKTLNWLSRYYHKLPLYMNRTKGLLENYSGRILITVKLTLGLALATVLAAGLSKMSPKKFFFYNTLGGIGVVAEMILIGYLFGESYKVASEYFNIFAKIILALAILAVIAISILNRRRNRI